MYPIFLANLGPITASPGVNKACTCPPSAKLANPPRAKVSILVGFNGDAPTYFNAKLSQSPEAKDGLLKNVFSKSPTILGSLACSLLIICPSNSPSLKLESVPE